ncbi:unnamed protein product, partial [Rotaria magnacalcarata]
MNLFEQFCATKTTVTSSNKNDPRLANTTTFQPSTTTTIESANIPTTVTNTNNNNNKEDRESISNAVASLPPAQ